MAAFESRGFRTLFLTAEILLPDRRTGRPRARARIFELVVLPAGSKSFPPRARLLVETTRSLQARIRSRPGEDSAPIPGLSMGIETRFHCPICNYELKAPAEGPWFMTTKPPFLSGCLEEIEVYALDRNLAMELSIQTLPGGATDLCRRTLEAAASRLALGLGTGGDPSPPEATEIGGARGWRCALRVPGGGDGPPRTFLLYSLRSGRVAYMIAFQGGLPGLDFEHPMVRGLLSAFRVLDPGRKSAAESLAEGHGGGGVLEHGGFRHEDPPFRIHGPEGWTAFRRAGMTRFQVGWRNPSTGSFLLVAGLDRPRGPWTPSSALEWLEAWIRGHRGLATRAEGFRVEEGPRKVEIAGKKGLELRYSFLRGDGGAPASSRSGRPFSSCATSSFRAPGARRTRKGSAQPSRASGSEVEQDPVRGL